MTEYYQQSLLTIASTSGSAEEGLCPAQTQEPALQVAQLPYRDHAGLKRGNFYVLPCQDIDNPYQNFVLSSDLLTRGWVFQEWLLSQRIVCFTPGGTFMRCRLQFPRNVSGETLSSVSRNNAEIDDQATRFKNIFDFDHDFSEYSPFQGWYNIVEEYSGLNFTKQSQDRLKALSGLAAEYKEFIETKVKFDPDVAMYLKKDLRG